MSGFRKASGALPPATLDSFISAQKPAQAGALQLVPPIATGVPLSTTRPPWLGSAVSATSGTRRLVPAIVTFCQAGRGKKRLLPPPLPCQPDSLETLPSAASLSVVPPTPMTQG